MAILSIKDFDDEAMRLLNSAAALRGVRPKEILEKLIREAVGVEASKKGTIK